MPPRIAPALRVLDRVLRVARRDEVGRGIDHLAHRPTAARGDLPDEPAGVADAVVATGGPVSRRQGRAAEVAVATRSARSMDLTPERGEEVADRTVLGAEVMGGLPDGGGCRLLQRGERVHRVARGLHGRTRQRIEDRQQEPRRVADVALRADVGDPSASDRVPNPQGRAVWASVWTARPSVGAAGSRRSSQPYTAKSTTNRTVIPTLTTATAPQPSVPASRNG